MVTVIAIMSTFFISNYQSYLNLQENTVRMNSLSGGLQRMTRVLRGINSITDAQPASITGFAYFTPRDATLSKVRYFYNASAQSLQVGVIPASGSAPNYTYNSSSEQVYTIVGNIDGTQAIFKYLNVDGAESTFNTDTYKDIYGIRVVLTNVRKGNNIAAFQLQTAVSLRNRKTNL
jgi:hypothetical protein